MQQTCFQRVGTGPDVWPIADAFCPRKIDAEVLKTDRELAILIRGEGARHQYAVTSLVGADTRLGRLWLSTLRSLGSRDFGGNQRHPRF